MNAVTPPETAALAIAPRQQQFDIGPQTFEQALKFSQTLADSDLVPKDFKGKPGNCLIAMQWGAEVGLKPLQALQNLAVINGRPALWGDAVIAIVRGSPLCEYVVESDDGHAATCRVKRRGEPEQVRSFSMDDAQAAGLKGKQGPWTQYPKRMRQMRARAFALRDVFPDVLRGLPVAEEVMDTPAERNMGPVEIVPPPPPQNYDPAQFDANFKKWEQVIASGRKSAAELIQFVEAKGCPLTEEQKARLLSVKASKPDKPEAHDVQPKAPAPASAAAAPTYAQVADRIAKAQTLADLDGMDALIGQVADAGQRAELTAMLDQCSQELPTF